MRTEKFRYIRYSDGTEELYDREKDEMEWTNLAGDPKYAKTKKQIAKWLPKTNVPESTKSKPKRTTQTETRKKKQ